MGQAKASRRFSSVGREKSEGATYTPARLADFVAARIVEALGCTGHDRPLEILDPAVGDGELLLSLLARLPPVCQSTIRVRGYDTNPAARDRAVRRLTAAFPSIELRLERASFLDTVLDDKPTGAYDLIVANPPYVRTQVLGAGRAGELATAFGLTGRVDLSHAFLLGIVSVLKEDGVAGVIVSNRFMTTRAGEAVRQSLRTACTVMHVWDFGDTKLFGAAVLPAVLLFHGRDCAVKATGFTTIYQTQQVASAQADDPIAALEHEGTVEVSDGRRFLVKKGTLDDSGDAGAVWRIKTDATDSWLATVESHSWGTFRDIGRIRVGVKTCADAVFIGDDWDRRCEDGLPELLRPLTTHHVARRFQALAPSRPQHILYPHEVVDGARRAVDLARYPHARTYLERHRATLEARSYVLDAGRNWYEIWVPQDPAAWAKPKLVFRDIAQEPVFWVDLTGSVVNGDCYWLVCENVADSDLLWLAAAVANSKFIETFYDHRFHNKLYAGRRRFITQYVEEFPLPDPSNRIARQLIDRAKHLHEIAVGDDAGPVAAELEELVWRAFGMQTPSAPFGSATVIC
jgi:hypothetical protein